MTTIQVDRPTRAAAPTGEVVAYERISRFVVNRYDVDTTVVRNIDRQVNDNDQAAKAMGLGPVAQHFTDRNRSASQFATREREQWLALLEYVRSGAVAYVLVWLFDRAARTTDGTEALLAACREGGALIVQTAGMPVVADPHNPDDVFRLKLAGLLAEYEVAKMSVRQRRAKQSAADTGKPHGGKRRFGYELGMGRQRKEEADLVLDIAGRLLAGETLHSIATWLNDQGVPTPSAAERLAKGKEPALWTGSNLRTMMLRPHLAGLLVHKGKIVGPGTWHGILDEVTRDSLVHLLTDPSRRTSFTNARVYLLAGLARCHTCGEVLRGRPAFKSEGRSYACITGRHCHRPVADVDQVVEDRIVARLSQLDASGALVDSAAADQAAALKRQQRALQGRVKEAAAAYAVGELDLAGYKEVVGALHDQEQALADALQVAQEATRRPLAALGGMTGPGAQEAWDEASLGQRRAIIDLLCTVELIGAGDNRRRPLAAEDVVVTWRTA